MKNDRIRSIDGILKLQPLNTDKKWKATKQQRSRSSFQPVLLSSLINSEIPVSWFEGIYGSHYEHFSDVNHSNLSDTSTENASRYIVWKSGRIRKSCHRFKNGSYFSWQGSGLDRFGSFRNYLGYEISACNKILVNELGPTFTFL